MIKLNNKNIYELKEIILPDCKIHIDYTLTKFPFTICYSIIKDIRKIPFYGACKICAFIETYNKCNDIEFIFDKNNLSMQV